jgi:pyruvate dehydrogenase E2 component (dihydrolipoamide acetyltransferase)
MIELAMPALAEGMDEATIIAWFKKNGEEVTAGEELLELETDKATMAWESPEAGVLEIVAEEGVTLKVGELMARLLDPGEVDGRPTSSAEPTSDAPDPDSQGANGSEPAGASSEAENTNAGSLVLATPLARRLAASQQIDLASVKGTGPRGRVVLGDVAQVAGITLEPPLGFLGQGQRRDSRAPEPLERTATHPAEPPRGGPQGTKGEATIVELTRLQKTVARRMAEAKATVPDFQVETDVEMGAVIEARDQLKAMTADGRTPSFNDFIVRAAAIALTKHPRANGSYRDGKFELHSRVNVGIAVATDDALVVPVIADADQKSLGQIAEESRRLATAVREGTITPPELAGGTFTVSNLGMLGMTRITSVINPPQAAIVGVGSIRPTLALVDGQVVERQLMSLNLSCDHRIFYGADGAHFLSSIRELLEHPLALAL